MSELVNDAVCEFDKINDVVKYIDGLFQGRNRTGRQNTESFSVIVRKENSCEKATEEEKIAIIGMFCRLPGAKDKTRILG